MSLLAIDPGATECAFAYFREWDDSGCPTGVSLLGAAWFGAVPSAIQPVGVVVVERMQVDDRMRGKDPRYVLACQASGMRAAGYAEGRGATFVELTPTEWKGSEQKPIQHARMWDRVLTPPERISLGGEATRLVIERAIEKGASCRWRIAGADCYPKKWKTHNLLDAASLGCVYLGRMEKR